MKRSILVAAFGLLTTPVFAQDTTSLATQYVNMPEVQDMMTDMFSPTNMGNQIAASLPANVVLSEDKKRQIGLIMSEAMGDLRPKMEELMVSVSAKTFSADELIALIDFYSSEHGASVMTKMTPFMTNVMGQLQPEMQALNIKLMQEFERILQD